MPKNALDDPQQTVKQHINYRYELNAKIGAGGMGTVYRAYDHLTGETVALKRLSIAPNDLSFNSRTTNADARVAVAREFRTLATLRHPNIISVLDYGFDGDKQPFFTMTLLDDAQPFTSYAMQQDETQRLHLLLEMLQALMYLHRRGIIHRDLKPDNILVDGADVLRLLDFGLAVQPDSANNIAGTPKYIAPEVLTSHQATFAADLYAVGVIAYEIFAGFHPHHQAKTVTELLISVVQQQPDFDVLPVSEPLRQVIARLLAKDPLDRYQNAEATIKALCDAADIPIPTEDAVIRESFLQAADFVGRERQLETLEQALNVITRDANLPPDALTDTGTLPSGDDTTSENTFYLIGGESGVGKSRLIDEIRIRAMVRGVMVLRGQAVEGGGLPYQLWRQILRRLVLATPITDLEASILKAIVPDIDQLLRRNITPAPTLQGNEDKRRLIVTLTELFMRQTQPILLILEDLQWTEESLDPLQRLLEIGRALPLMIVGSYRSDERPTLPDDLNMPALILDRLSQSEITRLSTSILGSVGQQADVIDLLQRQTEGNVFFLVEVVRALADDAGSLAAIGTRTLPETVFAGGIADIVARRLHRVPQWAQTLLKLTAVLGRQVDMAVMRLLLPQVSLLDDAHTPPTQHHDETLEAFLVACNNAAVLEQVEGTWQFAHDKLREGVLDMLTDTERRLYHFMVADAIESVHQAQLTAYAIKLTQHYNAAAMPEKEMRYARLAGESLINSNRFEAQRLLSRAHALYHELDLTDLTLIAQIKFELGKAHHTSSDTETIRRWFREAEAIYELLGDEVGQMRSASFLAELEMQHGNPKNALPVFEKALAVYEKHGATDDIAGVLHSLSGVYHYTNNFETMLTYTQRAYEIGEQVGNLVHMARALNNTGVAYEFLGELDKARDYYERSLTLRRQIDDRFGAAFTLYNMAWLEDTLGNIDQCIEVMREAMLLFRDVGAMQQMAGAMEKLGTSLYQTGQVEQARQYLLQVLDTLQGMDMGRTRSSALLHLGTIERETGHYKAATLYLVDALRTGAAIEVSNNLIDVCVQLVLLLLALERPKKTLHYMATIHHIHEGGKHVNTQAYEQMMAAVRAHYGDEKVDAVLAKPNNTTYDELVQEMLKRFETVTV